MPRGVPTGFQFRLAASPLSVGVFRGEVVQVAGSSPVRPATSSRFHSHFFAAFWPGFHSGRKRNGSAALETRGFGSVSLSLHHFGFSVPRCAVARDRRGGSLAECRCDLLTCPDCCTSSYVVRGQATDATSLAAPQKRLLDGYAEFGALRTRQFVSSQFEAAPSAPRRST